MPAVTPKAMKNFFWFFLKPSGPFAISAKPRNPNNGMVTSAITKVMETARNLA
jgi:hypothetical protein